MAAPEGNQNAKKGKLFYEALRKKVVQDDTLLPKVAEVLLKNAVAGEPWAVKELIDRLDGKAFQATSIENPDGTPIMGLKVTFVEGNEDN